MYASNYLAQHLRTSSINQENTTFASKPDGYRMTYGDLFNGAEKIATSLLALGLKPGDRVAVQAEKSLTAVQLYIGVILAGGVYLPLNTAYTAEEIAYFLNDATPVVFICDPDKQQTYSDIANQASVKHLLTLDAKGCGSFPETLAGQTNGFETVKRNKDDLAAILYTSGTTGRSKGAMLSHGALASNAITLADYWHFDADDVLIHALPIFHTHGLFVALNVTMIAGSSMIFLPGFDADTIIDVMPQATCLMGVPTFYTRLLKHNKLNKQRVKSMRLFISGSAPMLVETHKNWHEKTGYTVLERYGMTETNMNTSNPYNGERRAGSVGFPLPDVEVRITSNGRALNIGETGDIEVRGPNLFQGYWKMPEKTREELREDGWFITGDLGRFDSDGYLSIVGRVKDLIISGGYNIYPKEIESIIDKIPGVEESAVIGITDDDLGETTTAIVVNETTHGPDEDAILAHLRKSLARYKQPRKIYFRNSLPRNSMGKVQKNILRDEYS